MCITTTNEKLTKANLTHLNTVKSKDNFLDPNRLNYVYRHCRKDTDQIFYIGVGKKNGFTSESREYSRAYTEYGRNRYWRRVAHKYGYYVEIMLDNLTYEESREKEAELVTLYGRTCNGGTLTNLTDGGDGTPGTKMSDEVRLKMSLSKKGKKKPPVSEETRRKIGLSSKNRYFSPEVRERKRKSMLGKKYPPEVAAKKRDARLKHCKQVLCLETGFFFDCALDVGKAMFPLYWKSAGARVTVVCNKKADNYKGFHFCYV